MGVHALDDIKVGERQSEYDVSTANNVPASCWNVSLNTIPPLCVSETTLNLMMMSRTVVSQVKHTLLLHAFLVTKSVQN
jgi:hypothetical protein